MKALLEFNLDDPVDREAHLRAVKSLDLALCLCDFRDQLRTVWKYSENEVDIAAAEKWRDALFEILASRGVVLDELVS